MINEDTLQRKVGIAINDPRKIRRRKQRKMAKSSYGDWKNAKRTWVDWLPRFTRRRRKGEGNVIPATLRPHVPHNLTLLRSEDWHAITAYWTEVKKVTTKKQFAHLQATVW